MLLNDFPVTCNAFSEEAEVILFCYNHCEIPALLEHQLKDKEWKRLLSYHPGGSVG